MNRRGFIASLIAIPRALRAMLEAPKIPEPYDPAVFDAMPGYRGPGKIVRPSDYDLTGNRRLWVIDWSDIRAVPELRHRFETKLARQLAMPIPKLP